MEFSLGGIFAGWNFRWVEFSLGGFFAGWNFRGWNFRGWNFRGWNFGITTASTGPFMMRAMDWRRQPSEGILLPQRQQNYICILFY